MVEEVEDEEVVVEEVEVEEEKVAEEKEWWKKTCTVDIVEVISGCNIYSLFDRVSGPYFYSNFKWYHFLKIQVNL